ncbi:MAG TPA: serine/threonine-protein kinase, partial [Polyangiaceae bacterium]
MILRGGRLARAADAVVDQYHLIAQIGAGGMAEVYVATREGRGGFRKLTCLKILRGELATEPDMVAMFMAEARIAARIEHPHVVQTFEVGESADGEHFIAMEYLEGQAYSRIRPPGTTRQAFPVALHLKVIAEALGGLHYAHEMRDFQGTPLNLVHRDMSPNNVMVTYDGVVKVLDFGIAKAAGASATRTGILKGTVGYMAPEQARGEELDRRTDLYAVGVMLWEALAGQRVWQGQNEVTILTKLLNEPIASPRTVDPSVPEELERICMKALAREREARYATAAELQADLERYLETSGARVTAREIGKAVSAA